MPLIAVKKRPRQRPGELSPQSLWKPATKKRANDFYSMQESRSFRPPTFDLGDIGDLSGGRGIDFIDQNVSAIAANVKQAAKAAEITMYCSIAAGLASVLLLIRTARR